MARALVLPVAVLCVACGGGCRRASPPDALADLELAPSRADEAPLSELPRIFLTRRAVVRGSEVVSILPDAGGLGEALGGPRGTNVPVAVGIDGRLPFSTAWPVLAELAGEGVARVELLVGSRSSPAALRACVAGRGRSRPEGDRDCWDRPSGREPRGDERDGGPEGGGGGEGVGGDGGDVERDDVVRDVGPRRDLAPQSRDIGRMAFDWSRPLELAAEIGPDDLTLRVQDLPFRHLAREALLGPVLDEAGTTLAGLRPRAGGERRCVLRPAGAVPWAEVVALAELLRANGFDGLHLEPRYSDL